MAPLRVVRSPHNAPVVVETCLGWVVFGSLPIPKEAKLVNSILHMGPGPEPNLHNLVKSFFSTEEFGVKTSGGAQSKDEARALQVVDQSMRRVGDRFEVGLLWKEDHLTLPESRHNALSRLHSMEKKADRNPDFANVYNKKMQHYLDSGYIRKLTHEEVTTTAPRKWYLPHFLTQRPNKPGKWRLVFDAAAVTHGTSLNANLLKGPDQLNPLPYVLSKFRQRRVAVSADIKEMFHQVWIKREDMDSQRLLWRGSDRNRDPDEMVMTVMTFGATCSPFCAQIVKNRNAKEWAADFPEAAEAVIKRHYVDDYLDSLDTTKEAFQLFHEVMEVQRRGGFHLCNWISNDKMLIPLIPVELRSDSQKSISGDKDNLGSERVLGLRWDPNLDSFNFSTNLTRVDPKILIGEKIPTKREALSIIMSIFDPMGFVANLTIKVKILLQKTWRSGVDWDDELPQDLQVGWSHWINELQSISEFQVPRCYSSKFSNSKSNIQLHIFCDASELAFATVAYFRVDDGNGAEVILIGAKTRVTPLKSLSIPRSELQAAVMGTRFALSISEAHDIKPSRICYWTDSSTVMCWLKMESSRLKQFVSHRVGEIQESTNPEDWRWVSTKDNVADEATRDDRPCSWSPNSRWLNGPDFLLHPEREWPTDRHNKVVDPEVLEIKRDFQFLGVLQRSKMHSMSTPFGIGRFSNWLRLIRTTAYVFRVVRNQTKLGPLTPAEVKVAEQAWWRWCQGESYPIEVHLLKKKGSTLTRQAFGASPLRQYSPYLDEFGVMRMRRRIPGTVLVGNLIRNPVILHPKHPYTVLMIKYHHEKAGHHGQERVMNELKTQFCIPTLRSAVRKSWNDCQHCKNVRAQPLPPEMGNLPAARLGSYQRPFTFTGLDYFGPMEVTIGRRREKRYGALFTCLTTRAVHMELAGSLNTNSCLMAMRRFFARRGHPKEIYSDNGTNFIGTEREMKEALKDLNQTTITDEMTTKGISWNFIPPYAPHMGGCWERMVRSIKTALYAILKERAPREEVMRTVLVEAENLVNGHPLTYVASHSEGEEILTPNHFLLGTPNNMQPCGVFTDQDLIPGKQWRLAQRLTDHFWSRWVTEFLPTLTKRTKWFDKQKPLQPGDIVIIVDNNHPRGSWPKGVIVEVPKTTDGQTRWAVVKTQTGTYKRPTAKLCVLDVHPPPTPEEVAEPVPITISTKRSSSNGQLLMAIEVMKTSGDHKKIMDDYKLWRRYKKLLN